MGLEFSKLAEKIFAPIAYPASEVEFLRQLRHAGGRYSDFSKIVEREKSIVGNLLEAARKLAGDRVIEPITSVSVALSTMGFLPARNFLAASVIQNHREDLIPGDKEISGILRFASMGESRAEADGAAAEDLFVAGMAFDVLRALVRVPDEQANLKAEAGRQRALKTGKIKETGARLCMATKVPDEIESCLLAIWAHGIQVAGVSRQLAGALAPASALERDLTLDGVLHDVGKAVYAVLSPETYLPWLESNDSKYHLETGRIEEEKLLEIPHDALGHLYLWMLGFVKESSWIVMYHHQPFLAQRLSKANQMRAIILWLADHLCHYRSHHDGTIDDLAIGRLHSCASAVFKGSSLRKFTDCIKGLKFIEAGFR